MTLAISKLPWPLAATMEAFCRGVTVGEIWGIHSLSCLKSSLENARSQLKDTEARVLHLHRESKGSGCVCLKHGVASISPQVKQSRGNAVCPKLPAGSESM